MISNGMIMCHPILDAPFKPNCDIAHPHQKLPYKKQLIPIRIDISCKAVTSNQFSNYYGGKRGSQVSSALGGGPGGRLA